MAMTERNKRDTAFFLKLRTKRVNDSTRNRKYIRPDRGLDAKQKQASVDFWKNDGSSKPIVEDTIRNRRSYSKKGNRTFTPMVDKPFKAKVVLRKVAV